MSNQYLRLVRKLEGFSEFFFERQARHGTRSPTKKRMRELDRLAAHIGELIRDAEEQNLSLERVPVWLQGWNSPWRGKLKGGELITKGEDELYDLGIRVRGRFPQLFNEEYHPDIYVLKATQVCSLLCFVLLIRKHTIAAPYVKAMLMVFAFTDY